MSQDKLLFILITILSITAFISFAMSPFFNIESIEISGMVLLEEDDLQQQLKEYHMDNIFLLDKRKIRHQLLDNPLIKEIDLSKNYPDKLEINLQERKPLAKINNHGQAIIFTIDGYILELKSEFNNIVPEIQGLAYSFDGNKITFSSLLEEIVQALENLDIDIRSSITNISYQDKQNLIANQNEIDIYFGEVENLPAKFRALESIIHTSDEEGLEISYIDLSLANKPVIKLK